MVYYYPPCRKTVKWTREFMLFATDGHLKQFHIFQKIQHRPKSKVQGLCFEEPHTWLCSENDRASRVKMRMTAQIMMNRSRQHHSTNMTATQTNIMTDPAIRLGRMWNSQNVSSSTKLRKRKMLPWGKVAFAQPTNYEKKTVLCVGMWCGTLQHSEFS